MKIIAVRAIPFAIPFDRPLHFASGSIEVMDNVLIEVETADGVIGVAEAPPRPYTYGETQASICAVVRDLFGPAVEGLSVSDREKVRARLNRTVANPTAKAAIDMAMWDAWARTLGVSVHSMLGGYRDRVRVSHMLGFQEPEVVAAQAIDITERYGITSFKVKVGRRPVADDVAVCRAVRAAVGPEAEIYIDGNRGWSASESVQALRMLTDVGLSRVEELCPADDVVGRRWLVTQCPVPFVADESAPNAAAATREVLGGSANALSIKTARTGFSDSLRMAHLAEGLGIEAVIGNQIDGQLGSACALAFAASQATTTRHAAELSNFLDMSDDLLTEPLHIFDGEMHVLPGPGIGVAIDPDKLTRYRVDR
jgi:L-alanine-DL-glutamate epimerase-like enolase superfamily enzyme